MFIYICKGLKLKSLQNNIDKEQTSLFFDINKLLIYAIKKIIISVIILIHNIKQIKQLNKCYFN